MGIFRSVSRGAGRQSQKKCDKEMKTFNREMETCNREMKTCNREMKICNREMKTCNREMKRCNREMKTWNREIFLSVYYSYCVTSTKNWLVRHSLAASADATEHTNQSELTNAWWTLSLPQTSRANPVQCYSTHQEKLCNIDKELTF